jgi:hypothetical protein
MDTIVYNNNILRKSTYGCIFQLNIDKTKIINAYSTRMNCSKSIGISLYKLRNLINSGSPYDKFYYIAYNNCPTNLVNDFIKK